MDPVLAVLAFHRMTNVGWSSSEGKYIYALCTAPPRVQYEDIHLRDVL